MLLSIVKKLPAVLIAAVGISFGFAGTALAGEIFAEKTLGSEEHLRIRPPNRSNTIICYKATDNKEPNLIIISVADIQNPRLIMIPDDMEDLKVSQESGHQCISINLGIMGVVRNSGYTDPSTKSQSIHVYVRQN